MVIPIFIWNLWNLHKSSHLYRHSPALLIHGLQTSSISLERLPMDIPSRGVRHIYHSDRLHLLQHKGMERPRSKMQPPAISWVPGDELLWNFGLLHLRAFQAMQRYILVLQQTARCTILYLLVPSVHPSRAQVLSQEKYFVPRTVTGLDEFWWQTVGGAWRRRFVRSWTYTQKIQSRDWHEFLSESFWRRIALYVCNNARIRHNLSRHQFYRLCYIETSGFRSGKRK